MMRANPIARLAQRWPRRPRRLRLLVAGPALALVVAACSAAVGAPGYTYAPPSSPSMAPMSTGPSASAPAPSGSMVPSGPASSGPALATPDPADSGAPAASAPPAGATAHISAQNIQFDTDHLEASAGQGWVLVFDNNDAGVPHNVEILDARGASVFRGDVVTGPTTVSYQVPALPAGVYKFFCDVHPTMTGMLTVR
jgi:plastocyanin